MKPSGKNHVGNDPTAALKSSPIPFKGLLAALWPKPPLIDFPYRQPPPPHGAPPPKYVPFQQSLENRIKALDTK